MLKMDQEVSDIIIFFGRFHPLILHLPIGFLVIAFVLEVLSRFQRFSQYKPAVGFTLLLGAGSAVMAAALGYMLAQAGGYNEELLFIHQWSGIALALLAVIAFILYWQLQRKPTVWLDRCYITAISLVMLCLSVAGHFGGSLTHGSDYLTQYMPDGLRSIAGLPAKERKEGQITNLEEAIIFEDIVYPILDAKCISCHSESKSKGDLMLHTKEALLKGGENGPIFIAGDADQSELMKRIHLPEIDEDHMPPKGKRQLTDEEITLLAWWINEEASFDKKVAEVNVDEKVQPILNALVDPEANKSEVDILLAAGVEALDENELVRLQSKDVRLRPVSAGTNWLQAQVLEGASGDSLVANLTGLAKQLIWLDLGNTNSTDKIFSSVVQFKNLTRLHLENTMVTDEGLQHLKKLSYLQYLNLHGTDITDEGIQQLADLKNLRKLYVWQTQVTKEGATTLKENLPNLEVILGIQDIDEDPVENSIVTESKVDTIANTNVVLTKN